MNSLEHVLQDQGKPRWRGVESKLLLLLVVLVGWAYFAQVDRVVTAPGKVIPSDKVKVIQHLEGGIIETLYVRENQRVEAGQPLMELDLATVGVNQEELKTRLGSLEFARLRLLAEVNDTVFELPAELPDNLIESARAEQYTFESRLDELKETLASLRDQREQAAKRVTELEARLDSQRSSMQLAIEQLNIATELLKDKLVSRVEHTERKAAVEQYRGEIASTREAIKGALALVSQSDSREREENARFKRRASGELGEIERSIASLEQEIVRSEEQQTRAVITSPISGFIKNVKYQSAGNVVKPGEPIMEIVPENEQLVIEAKLAPSDRGFVIEDQSALVKITAFDFYRHGGLEGKVQAIAADTNVEQDNTQYYRVIIVTDKSYVGDDEDAMQISPGMLGEVSIKVDTQSVLWALIRPILRIQQEALQET